MAEFDDFETKVLPDLLERFVSGKIDEESCARLHRFFESSPEHLRLFTEQLRTHFLLHDIFGSRASSEMTTKAMDWFALQALSSAAPSTDGSKRRVSDIPMTPATFYRNLFAIVIIIMIVPAGVFFEFFVGVNSGAKNEFQSVAKIVEAVEAEWEGGAETFKKGQELAPSSLRLKSGIVKLEFVGGAEVVLEGPVEFLVRDKDEGFCQQGRLSVSVPPKAVGFEIASPMATVVDLGTRFSMQVSEGATEVHVIEGKVETKAPRRDKLQLLDGLAALFTLREEPKTLQADPKTFFDENRLVARKQAYAEKRRDVWQRQRHRLESDPSLVYRLEPDAVSHLTKTTGSRDDQKAIHFRHARDRVVLPVRMETRSLTLIASVRLDSLRNAANTLLMGNDFYTTPGAVHWQINRFGVLQFHLSDGKSAVMFDTEPMLRREDIGTWGDLALVADAGNKTITHYFEGRRVSTAPWSKPTPIRLDHLTLGNESSGSSKSSIRFFNGDMEDFWIFSRPFSATEIEEFHHNIQ